MGKPDLYATAVPDRSLGDVRGRQIRQFVFDVEATAESSDVGDAEEILIRLNGRVIKRVNRFTAERLGLITDTR